MSNKNSSSNTSITSSECDSSDLSFDEEVSLCNDLSKLTPYSFEPLASSSSSEDENENISAVVVKEKSETRSRNTKWCQCNHCKPMESENESICCHEMNEISEENFEGKQNTCLFIITLVLLHVILSLFSLLFYFHKKSHIKAFWWPETPTLRALQFSY